MHILIAEQVTGVAIGPALATILPGVDITDYENFRLIVGNEGGGSADDITDVTCDSSADNSTWALDAVDVSPPGNIVSGVLYEKDFVLTTNFLRIRAKTAGGDDTTASCFLLGDLTGGDVDTYALTTLVNVKDFMGITTSEHDAVLTRLINAMTD